MSAGEFDLRIATARIGDPFMALVDGIAERWTESGSVLLAFGAPSRGLHEIAADEHLKLEDIADFIVNTIPNQGTATVRAEEALLASLALFNAHFSY
jgi:predicted SPOUT superfamily RNA methylase MTH1